MKNTNEMNYGASMSKQMSMMTESTFKRNTDMTLTISNNS
jgi:hypothetical protein